MAITDKALRFTVHAVHNDLTAHKAVLDIKDTVYVVYDNVKGERTKGLWSMTEALEQTARLQEALNAGGRKKGKPGSPRSAIRY